MGNDAEHWADDRIEDLLNGLRDGQSLREICKLPGMPNAATVWRWSKADDELASSIVRAREVGYHERAERAVEAAKVATDAGLGRLAFDAERWHLSKLSRAFADKVVHSGDPDEPVNVKHVHRIELVAPGHDDGAD